MNMSLCDNSFVADVNAPIYYYLPSRTENSIITRPNKEKCFRLIIYLEPKFGSEFVNKVKEIKEYLSENIGADNSFKYHLHCSLTGFFDITHEKNNLDDVKIVVEKIIKSFLYTLTERYTAASKSTTETVDSETNNIESNLFVIKHDDAFNQLKLIENDDIVAKELYTSVPRRLSERALALLKYKSMGVLSALDRKPAKLSQSQKYYNNELQYVRIAEDNSLYLPITVTFLPPTLLAELCSELSVQLQMHNYKFLPIKNIANIRTKRADHISLLSAKGRDVPLTTDKVVNAAFQLDQQFNLVREISWDLVVYQCNRVEDDADLPLKFNEIIRIKNIANSLLKRLDNIE